ncbi:alanine--tRNA ligase [Aquiluna sp. KACHI24]|uniref:alanine--tRNA ligase n=1 Tax=Aquiluna sp. KACHI24 TaxID=2968831 RepID=UPI002201A631|nr:alanine--tRNA ligase [Aquiluna sp. KACHI24]BDQ00312.1 alanine--tRNA ligase [Aquiluna sp. KACHI24]
MKTAEIKRRWLEFFERKGHTVVPSAPLISQDPTLMFVVAGMVPFIPYMTGVLPAPYSRATSVQKCVRTLDIDEVGKTTRHGTFFQMNGNFSFGDYFKEEAIAYAWELLTGKLEDGGLGFDPERLWVTVYQDDDEAIDYWLKNSSVPRERIQKRGMKDNYWSTGQRGPAGPCSEIYFDRGPEYGVEGGPEADEDRYIEIWNLVFMQYERADGGTKDHYEILGELPKKNIDTGMGLERVAFLLQGVENIYEIDQVRPLIDVAAELSGKRYGANEQDDVKMRVVADHIRSALMLMSDGVTPSNEGRGYILRRLLRRSIRALRLIGVSEPSFERLFTTSKNAMVEAYPELEESFPRVLRSALAEEAGFRRTLEAGTVVLEDAISNAKGTLGGDIAFLLHDTYGFPIDLTQEIAEENGLSVDREEFNRLMTEQKQRAKEDAKSKKVGAAGLQVYSEFRQKGETQFLGYESLSAEGRVLGLIRDGEVTQSLREGELGELFIDKTSLYAESGGQAADAGIIRGDGFELEVLDVQKPVKGLFSHKVRVLNGEVTTGTIAETLVDANWRLGACQAHSATHVVHAALRQVLGPEALQSGSFNKPGYMRLDFAWGEALSESAKSEIEEVSNLAIRSDLAVSAQFMTLPEAKEWGAIALFGETYDESVRVVQVGGPWSRELCGGTHVSRSSQIGLVSISNESSVGSGARRIEAFVGIDALRNLTRERDLVKRLAASVKAPAAELESKIADALEELRQANRKIAELEAAQALAKLPALLASAQEIAGLRVLSAKLENTNSESLRNLATAARDQLGGKAVVILGAEFESRPTVMVACGQQAIEQGIKAGELAKAASAELGGGGGGKADLAQGGGTDAGKLDAAIAIAAGLIR